MRCAGFLIYHEINILYQANIIIVIYVYKNFMVYYKVMDFWGRVVLQQYQGHASIKKNTQVKYSFFCLGFSLIY